MSESWIRYCYSQNNQNYGILFCWWFARSYFDFAGQRARMHFEKIHDDLSHVFRLDFPGIFLSRDIIVEMSGDRSRQYGSDFYIILPYVLHQSLCESDQTKFTCIVSGPAGEEIDSGKARSEEHTSELQSRGHIVCRLL